MNVPNRSLSLTLAGAALAGAVVLTTTLATARNDTLPHPVTDADFRPVGQNAQAKIALGRALFFDKILSGNQNISCATRHHPRHGTADGVSLATGEGAKGLGPNRDAGTGRHAVHARIPRNAPALFNLGAIEYTDMFHDGRVALTGTGIISPAGQNLPKGLDSVLAAQALFPVTSPEEMAGQEGENPIADAAAAGDLPRIWDLLADRLRGVPGYRKMFREAFGVAPDRITYVHAANAIAAFEASEWRSDDSPFDKYLRGNKTAMSKKARRGMDLFYGDAGCASCHSGKFQTDHRYHVLAMPQLGPGKGDGETGIDDWGRARVTGLTIDRYRFRTPSLRNVALTAPYGHAGGYATLEAVIQHHMDPRTALAKFDRDQIKVAMRHDLVASDFTAFDDRDARTRRLLACEDMERPLTRREIGDVVAFLHALPDPTMVGEAGRVPATVPSGLPVAD